MFENHPGFEEMPILDNNNKNNKNIHIAPILFRAKRFTMLQKGLNKKIKNPKIIHIFLHNHKITK